MALAGFGDKKNCNSRRSRRWIACVVCVITLLGWLKTATPSDRSAVPSVPILLTDTIEVSPIGQCLEIFEDPTGRATLDEIMAIAAFSRSTQAIPNFGFSHSAYWVRFTVRNQERHPSTRLMEIGNPFIDSIRIYEFHNGMLFSTKESGDTVEFRQRDVPHRNFVFQLEFGPQEEATLYLRFQNKGRMAIAITLWQPIAFAVHAYHQQFASGIFYGAALIMLGYNLLLFWLLKERIYGQYILLLASIIIMVSSNEGFAYQYLWPTLPWWNDVSLNAFVGLTSILSLWFSAQFLRLAEYSRSLCRATTVLQWIWGILTALFVITRHPALPQLIVGLALPGPLLLIAAAFFVWRKGYQPARYYLLSWGIFFAGAFVEVLGIHNVIPVELISGRGLRVGLVLALAFISLALSDRINLLKFEKADAQAKALQAAQENEQLILEQNLVLERSVAERTAELRASNEQLHQEIAERKRAELTLRKLEKAMETTEAGITITDPEGRIVYINPADARQHGYTVEEALGFPAAIFAPMQQEQTDDSEQNYVKASGLYWKRERMNVRKDGSAFPVELISTPLHDEQGVYLGRVTVCEDITEQQQAELKLIAAHKELQQKNRELQEVNASKDKFFSIISHDLRNPLSVILGMTELLRENFEHYTPERAKEFLTRMYAAAERLHILLENLLTWSRLQRGVMEYHPEDINLFDIGEENRDLFLEKAAQKGITLVNAIPPKTRAFADHGMMNTVIRNLVSNALKFTTAGDLIEIAVFQRDSLIELSIRDTGIGIAPEDMEKLFRIDVQHSQVGTAGERGTGLGLILCQELVERNGGAIWVESQPGQGATFHLTLPAQKK
ncbi:sensory transduction histidine kinase [Candidatus Moduliflexus flocculans]|uniref:histidine kinase n=1 Tax=Candidatus Moduliflexus flocculans TaxID=1499966 RepID=A0A0S6VRU8_9BACT|nr:sensory transduction histidine kinase [Candidatus Moduliflexus flocculans]